jgi:hypothetical protein
MTMDIRRATLEDAPVIAQYNCALAEETEGLSLHRTLLLRGVRRVLKDHSKGFYILAMIDGRVAGQLSITFE